MLQNWVHWNKKPTWQVVFLSICESLLTVINSSSRLQVGHVPTSSGKLLDTRGDQSFRLCYNLGFYCFFLRFHYSFMPPACHVSFSNGTLFLLMQTWRVAAVLPHNSRAISLINYNLFFVVVLQDLGVRIPRPLGNGPSRFIPEKEVWQSVVSLDVFNLKEQLWFWWNIIIYFCFSFRF